MRRWVLALVIALSAAGCRAGRVATWEKGLDLTRKGDDSALVAQGDQAFENRGDEASLRRSLERWEQAAAQNPGNGDTLVKLARGYYLLADGHLFFGSEDNEKRKEEMLNTFEAGVRSAERALVALSPEFRKKVQAGTKVKDAIDVLGKEAVPALYWWATSTGKWARAKGTAVALFWRDTVKKCIQKVLSFDRGFWWGAADRYFGAYYAYLPGIFGGDAKKAKEHFDKALEIAPAYLATKVLLADLYYTKKEPEKARRRELFEKTLREVLAANPDAIPGIGPEQRIEQKKAALLLKEIDERF
jgi:tetratricopeptide (TPR) repeat protein